MRWDTPARALFDAWFDGPPPRTEAELAALFKAAGMEVSQQTVNRWRNGDSRPEEDRWPVIEAVMGIPPLQWLTPAATTISSPRAA